MRSVFVILVSLLVFGPMAFAGSSYQVACIYNPTNFTVFATLKWSNDKPHSFYIKPREMKKTWTPDDDDVPSLQIWFDKDPSRAITYKNYTLPLVVTEDRTCAEGPTASFLVLPVGDVDLRSTKRIP